MEGLGGNCQVVKYLFTNLLFIWASVWYNNIFVGDNFRQKLFSEPQ
jgi:hypothetical protein